MSLKKRKFTGELSKRELIRDIVIGGILAGILLTAWIAYPSVIDAFFGGSRGGYTTQADLPTTKQTYNLTAIPFKINVVIDPTKLTPDMINLLKTLFDSSDLQLPSNFTSFNITNYNIVLFSYQDLSYSPYNNGIMRQDAYDTISSDGSSWSKSSSTTGLFNSQNYDHGTYSSSCRKILFNMTSTTNINMKLPFFPYTPTYVKNSLMFQDVSGSSIPSNLSISDSGTLYKNQYNGASIQASGLPSFSKANLTYCIREDPAISSSMQSAYKTGSTPSLFPYQNSPSTYTNYIQMPGVDVNTRDLTSFLANHPRFNTAYTYLRSQGDDKYSTPTYEILNNITTYLYSNYDLYTNVPASGPQRPPAGQDMVEWFLGRPKTTYPNAGGTPYDFAAAFVMLARAFDIPSRIATGFYDWDGDHKIEVMNAYAWAEAYLPTQSSPVYNGNWIVYDFPANYNLGLLNNPTQFINVNVPAQGSTFNSLNNIPLDIFMHTSGNIANVTYSLDGASPPKNVSKSSIGNGNYQNLTTFSVASMGSHKIQAFMSFTNGTIISSLTNSFTVSPPMPDASFTPSTPITITQYQSVSFRHTGSNGTAPATWYWNFGDGTSSIVENPVHQFNTIGTFNVSLTVTDANGNTSTVTHIVNVIPDNYPDASFKANQTNILAGNSVLFTRTGTNGYAIATWSWNFGDTGTSAQVNPVHQYNTPGVYDVSLTITDIYGETSTVQRLLYIYVNSTGTSTTITVDFTPKSVELFQDINITGYLRDSYGTGISGQLINIQIEYHLGTNVTVETTSATTSGDGSYKVLNHEVTKQSDLIQIIVVFPGTTLYLPSSNSVEG